MEHPGWSWTDDCGFCNWNHLYGLTVNTINNVNMSLQQSGHKLVFGAVDGAYPNKMLSDKQLLITNNHYPNKNFDSARYVEFPSTWYGVYAGTPAEFLHTPEFDYNCLISRMDPVRQSWLYQLVRRDMFDLGLVSFTMDVSRHIMQGKYKQGTSAEEVFEDQYQKTMTIFDAEHQKLKPIVPYRNFNASEPSDSIIMRSKFSIVLDTFFHDNNIITFSEKIFRCLKMPRPWILFNVRHSVKYLKELGFDVLNDVVNHDYDDIEFEIARQVRMLDTAQELCKLKFTKALESRLKSAAATNQQILNDLAGKFVTEIINSINEAKEKCLML